MATEYKTTEYFRETILQKTLEHPELQEFIRQPHHQSVFDDK